MNGTKSEVQPRFRYSDNVSVKEREKVWVDAKCLADVHEALKTYQETKTEVKLVVGNTAAGYYKDIKPNVYIDISKARHSFFNHFTIALPYLMSLHLNTESASFAF